MIQKNLLKLAIVGLTAGLFISAQSAQTNKEIPQPKKEVVAKTDAQLPKADPADQKDVAMMKGEPVGEMQKFDSQDSCGKSAPCKPCNECTPSKPCKSCSKCEPKGCTKEVKKCTPCNKCEQKPCGCKKCEEAPKSCNKGAAKTAVEG